MKFMVGREMKIGAEFTADGEPTWHDDALQKMLERGIVANNRLVIPSDGKAFFDALPIAFASSTFIHVEDEP